MGKEASSPAILDWVYKVTLLYPFHGSPTFHIWDAQGASSDHTYLGYKTGSDGCLFLPITYL